MESVLSELYRKARQQAGLSLVRILDALRCAASILCGSINPHPSISYYLVSLPFEIFSEESINLGISLWMGAIHENPRVEPKILVEVVNAWERTIQRKRGLFDPSFK